MRAEEFRRRGADLAVDRGAVDALRVDAAFGERVLAFKNISLKFSARIIPGNIALSLMK